MMLRSNARRDLCLTRLQEHDLADLVHDKVHQTWLWASQLVEGGIRSSMEAAYTRLQLAAEAAEAPAEERLTALACSVGGLLDEVEGTFASALCTYVLDAAGVAAASLCRLFGAALRPWMSTGEAPAAVGGGTLP